MFSSSVAGSPPHVNINKKRQALKQKLFGALINGTCVALGERARLFL